VRKLSAHAPVFLPLYPLPPSPNWYTDSSACASWCGLRLREGVRCRSRLTQLVSFSSSGTVGRQYVNGHLWFNSITKRCCCWRHQPLCKRRIERRKKPLKPLLLALLSDRSAPPCIPCSECPLTIHCCRRGTFGEPLCSLARGSFDSCCLRSIRSRRWAESHTPSTAPLPLLRLHHCPGTHTHTHTHTRASIEYGDGCLDCCVRLPHG
jgi:hypothetical protein